MDGSSPSNPGSETNSFGSGTTFVGEEQAGEHQFDMAHPEVTGIENYEMGTIDEYTLDIGAWTSDEQPEEEIPNLPSPADLEEDIGSAGDPGSDAEFLANQPLLVRVVAAGRRLLDSAFALFERPESDDEDYERDDNDDENENFDENNGRNDDDDDGGLEAHLDRHHIVALDFDNPLLQALQEGQRPQLQPPLDPMFIIEQTLRPVLGLERTNNAPVFWTIAILASLTSYLLFTLVLDYCCTYGLPPAVWAPAALSLLTFVIGWVLASVMGWGAHGYLIAMLLCNSVLSGWPW